MSLRPQELRKQKKWWATILWVIAIVATTIWVAYAVALTVPRVVSCSGNWGLWIPFTDWEPAYFYQACLTLNEFGDFLAGTFAPLAFLWLVLAVILQSAELKEQRLALVAQLQETQELSRMQAAELAMRNAQSAREKLDHLLLLLRSELRYVGYSSGNDEVDGVAYFTQYGKGKIQKIMQAVSTAKSGETLPNHQLNEHRTALMRGRNMLPKLESLISLRPMLSGTDLQTFEDCHLPQLIETLTELREYVNEQETSENGA